MDEEYQQPLYRNQMFMNKDIDRRAKKSQEEVKTFPYNCIGLLILKTNTQNPKEIIATGFLISSNLVLTSAHSMFIHFKNRTLMAEPIAFYPGIDGETNSPFRVDSWRTKAEFLNENLNRKPKGYKFTQHEKQVRHFIQFNYDYMLVKLKKHIDRQEYIRLYSNFYPKYKIEVVGYPGDKAYASHYHQFSHEGLAQVKKDNVIYYKIDTSYGQSGSPLLWRNAENQYFAVGIHKGGTIMYGKEIGCGVAFSDLLTSQIKSWEEELRCGVVAVKGEQKARRIAPGGQRYTRETYEMGKSASMSIICSQDEAQQKKPFVLNWNRDIPSFSHFRCSSIVQRKTNNNNDYLQIASNPLPLTGTFNLKLKIVRYNSFDSVIAFGLMSEQNLKKDYSSGLDFNSFAICFDRQKEMAFILEKKQDAKSYRSDEKLYVKEGGQVFVWINMDEWTFTLAKPAVNKLLPLMSKSQYINTLPIPSYLADRQLYLFITFKNVGDCIEIQCD